MRTNASASIGGEGLSERDGRELAVQLICELEASDSEFSPYSLEAEYRPPGKDLENILLRYLDAIDSRGSREVKVGFAAIITGYLSVVADGSVPDSGYVERFLDASKS